MSETLAERTLRQARDGLERDRLLDSSEKRRCQRVKQPDKTLNIRQGDTTTGAILGLVQIAGGVFVMASILHTESDPGEREGLLAVGLATPVAAMVGSLMAPFLYANEVNVKLREDRGIADISLSEQRVCIRCKGSRSPILGTLYCSRRSSQVHSDSHRHELLIDVCIDEIIAAYSQAIELRF